MLNLIALIGGLSLALYSLGPAGLGVTPITEGVPEIAKPQISRIAAGRRTGAARPT